MSGIQGGSLYIGEDNLVFWGDRHIPQSGLYDNVLEAFVNDATVTFTLKDSNNNPLSGATAISMPYLAGSNGVYEGVLDEDVSLTSGATYYLEITANASGGRVGFRRISYLAKYHNAV